jgi:hypothetical protein
MCAVALSAAVKHAARMRKRLRAIGARVVILITLAHEACAIVPRILNIIRIVVACRDFLYIISAAVDWCPSNTSKLDVACFLTIAIQAVIAFCVVRVMDTRVMDLVA